jgi:phosphate transport system substrate-binding protein
MSEYQFHRFIKFVFLVIFLSVTSLPVRAETGLDKPIITGAGAHFSWAVMNDLHQQLEERTGKKIQLYGRESMMGAGCNAGIKHALSGGPENNTFGLVCCPLSKEETTKKQLRVFPLALEPILILVNESNSIDNLTSAQVRAIFKGKIVNWAEVGGDDSPIVAVTRLHCKSRPGHWKTILPNAKEFRPKRLNVKSAADMIKRISDFSGGFGHTGSAWVFDPNDKVKVVKVDGYSPTAKNLKEGNYPFFRELSAVTSMNPSADVLKVIHAAQELLVGSITAARYELVPLKITEIK